MIVNSLPIVLVDLFGSIAMIVLSLLSLSLVHRIKSRDPNGVIWRYLQWVCMSLTLFAVSRSAGHILKQFLVFSEHADLWQKISPFSGGFNTLMFVVVGSVTLFFNTVWRIYQEMETDKAALQTAHLELVYFNQHLEDQVKLRTSELSRSESKYRRIFEISRDVIMVTSINGEILDLNPAGYNVFKLTRNALLQGDMNIQSFFADQKDWDKLSAILQKKGFLSTREMSLIRTDGSSMLSLISCSLNAESDEASPTIHYLIKDIEQRRLIDKHMIQADKLASIGEFSAGIAHEINNPLGIILGYTQLLLRNEKNDSGKAEDLKIIEKHVQNCKSIVSDLLNFARSSKTLKKEEDIHKIIDEVVNFVQQHAGGREQIRFVKSYNRDTPHLNVDGKKIRQVIMNLVMNARHAINTQGSIFLSTQYNLSEKQVKVIVKDEGYGIDQKNLSRIFDPFFTTKPTGEGTGLGLSVSYGIVRDHGGNIYVNSTVGKGSEFTVVLPVDNPA